MLGRLKAFTERFCASFRVQRLQMFVDMTDFPPLLAPLDRCACIKRRKLTCRMRRGLFCCVFRAFWLCAVCVRVTCAVCCCVLIPAAAFALPLKPASSRILIALLLPRLAACFVRATLFVGSQKKTKKVNKLVYCT